MAFIAGYYKQLPVVYGKSASTGGYCTPPVKHAVDHAVGIVVVTCDQKVFRCSEYNTCPVDLNIQAVWIHGLRREVIDIMGNSSYYVMIQIVRVIITVQAFHLTF